MVEFTSQYTPSTNRALDEVVFDEPLDSLLDVETESTPTRDKNRDIDIVAITEQALEEVETKERDQAVFDAKASLGNPLEEAVATAITTPEITVEVLEETVEKQEETLESQDFFLERALTVGDPAYSPALARLVTNQQIAVEILQDKFREPIEQGYIKTGWDFFDRYILRQIPIGLYEDITGRGELRGFENALAQASMSNDDFRRYFTAYADELTEEGFFTGENFFAFTEAYQEAINGGYDPEVKLNRIFGLLEIGSLAPVAIKALSAGSAITRAGGVRGVGAATDAAKALDRTPLITEPEILSETGTISLDATTPSGATRPSSGGMSHINEENAIVTEVEHMYDTGSFGVGVPDQVVQERIQEVASNITAISSRPVVTDPRVTDVGLGRKAVVVDFGTMKKGNPFAYESNAVKFKDQLTEKGLSAEVVPHGEGFVVRVTERLDTTRLAAPIDTSPSFTGFLGSTRSLIARVFGSSAQVDDPFLNTLALQAEGAQGAILEASRPYFKKLDKLNYDSKVALGNVFVELNRGRDSFLRTHYSDTEFAVKFQQYHPKGLTPTQKDIEAYYAAQTINDAAYILDANRLADRYVSKGYKRIDTGVEQINAKRIDNVRGDETVFDVEKGFVVRRSDLDEDVIIWKSDVELEGGIEYVAKPKDVKEIRYSDVLGYNAGGRRTNYNTNYFVTLGDGAGRAILGTFSQKQAKLAVRQIGDIKDYMKKHNLTVDMLTTQLDDVIRANNDWNPSIENTADFKSLIESKGWNLDAPVSFKQRDSIVEGTGDLFDGLTYSDFVQSSKRRNDDVLMDFGGGEVDNYNPVTSIVDQMGSAAKSFSFNEYTQTAKTAWLKKALRVDTIPEGFNINELFERTIPKGVEANRLEQLRETIKRREMVDTKSVAFIKHYGQELSEFVFEKSGTKIKALSNDPTNVMLKLGFQSAFGFLNLFQFALQSSHALAMVALSPIHGGRAAALTLPFRLALASGSDEAITRFAKVSGMSVEDSRELFTYVKTSGRYSVENDAMEKGTGVGFGLSGWEGESFLPTAVRKGMYQTTKVAKKAGDVGLLPFTEGERLSRLTGILTSFFEYKAKYKGASALTDSARPILTAREHALSFNMTTTSRAAFQDGLMRVPTQWLSYSFRAMESLVLGRQFTKGERVRLAAFLSLQGGLFGLGLDRIADELGEALGLSPDGLGYVSLKYGVIDGVLSWGLSQVTDQEIRSAIGTRMAPLTTFFEIHKKVTQESTLSALGGPSSEIVFGGLSNLASSIGNLYNGHFESAKLDLHKFLRTPSGVDNVTKMIGIMNYGTYTSKTGSQVDLEFSNTEALMRGAGITNFKEADFYARRTNAFADSRQVRKFTKDVVKDYREALAKLNKGDEDTGTALMDEIHYRILFSGFSPYDQMEIRKRLKAETTPDTVVMAINYLRRKNMFGAKVVENY